MHTQLRLPASGNATAARTDDRLELLEEVDFKWLMAGQGWWVDTWRLHTDADYATRLLHLVEQAPSEALRTCAAHLQAQFSQRQRL